MWMFLAAALVLVLVAAVISYPLVAHRLEPYVRDDPPDESYSERDALLDDLSDLEESFRAGKLSQDDYNAQRERLQVRYIDVVEPGDAGS